MLQVVTGDGIPAGDALVRHPDIRLVSLTGDVEMERLNFDHMGERGPTDVLSFPLHEWSLDGDQLSHLSDDDGVSPPGPLLLAAVLGGGAAGPDFVGPLPPSQRGYTPQPVTPADPGPADARQTIAAGAAAVVVSAGVAVYRKLRRKKDPAAIERLRRLSLGKTGRITTGEISGLVEPDGESTALQLVYRYDVAGVTYEVTQDVSAMPAVAARAPHLVGRGISVKYDVKHPTNSIVVCETCQESAASALERRRPVALLQLLLKRQKSPEETPSRRPLPGREELRAQIHSQFLRSLI